MGTQKMQKKHGKCAALSQNNETICDTQIRAHKRTNLSSLKPKRDTMTHSGNGRTSRTFRRLRAQVLKESDICWLCGQSGSDTVDHVIPLSVAPDLGETLENLRPAHLKCNSSRGNRLRDGVRPLPSSRVW